VIVGLLRARHLAAVAQREIEVARAVEDDAAAEVVPRTALRALPEEDLHVLEAVAGEPSARELGTDPVVAARRVGEVHELVFLELGVRHHVVQAALPVHRDLRQAGDRLRLEPALAHHAQPARLLRHQHAPVGKKRKRPGLLEALHHLHHLERVLVGFVRLGERGGAERQSGD